MAVRIPKAFVKEAEVAYGTVVNLSVEDGKIVIAPRREPARQLENLLNRVTPENLHGEVDTGDAVGREIE